MKAKTVNFERHTDPMDSLKIGLWKPFKDVFVTLEEFKENGGVLEEGRTIFNSNGSPIGTWIGYDKEQEIDLFKGSGFRSMPVTSSYGVKIKAKVMYK